MPSQHSACARLHPGYETAIQRQRREGDDELTAYLIKAAVMRERLTAARVLASAK